MEITIALWRPRVGRSRKKKKKKIKKPTRFNANSGSLIDHIWTNVSLDKSICSAIITHPLSDHLPLFLSYTNSFDHQSKPKMQRFFSSAKITLFNNELQKVNIDPALKETDPDISFKILLKDYMNLFNKYFPKQVIKDNRKNHNWFDDELKKLLSNKEALFKKYMQAKSPETKRQFTKARNLYFRKIQQKKQEHIKNKLESNKNDIKATWRTLNSLLGKKNIPECKSLYTNSNKITDPQQLANLFYDHFIYCI